jgi:hypothetical protein
MWIVINAIATFIRIGELHYRHRTATHQQTSGVWVIPSGEVQAGDTRQATQLFDACLIMDLNRNPGSFPPKSRPAIASAKDLEFRMG